MPTTIEYNIDIISLNIIIENNPIELAWSSVKTHVKMNNTTFKLLNVKQLLIKGIK